MIHFGILLCEIKISLTARGFLTQEWLVLEPAIEFPLGCAFENRHIESF